MRPLRPGSEFYHENWLEPEDKSRPMHCVVTRVTKDGVYWKPKSGGKSAYFPHEDTEKRVKQVVKEDGAVMSAGTGGFSNSSAPAGPVAGYDPIMKMRKKVKQKILKRASPPPKLGGFLGDSY